MSRASLRTEIDHNTLPLTSDNVYSEIQRDLLPPVFISSLMTSDTFLRDWVLGGENDSKSVTKYLKEIQENYDTVTAFFVSEKTRKYYHAGGVLKKVSPDGPRDSWYFRVQEMEDEYEINVDPDMANKDAMTIFVNYRVYDYSGQYIGATGVGLTVTSVKRLIGNYQAKYSRNIYFVDRTGEVKLSGTGFSAEKVNFIQGKQFLSFTEKLTPTMEESFQHKYGKETVHTNIRYISEFQWYLVVEQAESETIRQIFYTLMINLSICALVTCVVIVLIKISIAAYQKRIETLKGIVPICSFCKQIRDDKGYWSQVEEYVAKHTEAQFSHGVCPHCMEKHYSGFLEGREKPE